LTGGLGNDLGNPSQHLITLGVPIVRGSPLDYGLENSLWDGKTLSAFISKHFSVELGVRQCQRLFRQLGFGLCKPRPAMAGADPVKQKEYYKLHDIARNDTRDLWAVDEVHFQLHDSRCRIRVPPENKDPVVLHNPTRQKVGYSGAVRLRDGKFFAGHR
jgi:hypothetical protein